MQTYSYRDVSDWFLSKESMSPKKLQKLTYYSEAWSNALFKESLINDTSFEAWVHGPVSPELYKDYKEYGWNEIPQKPDNSKRFIDKVIELLESVWETYGDKSANELEALTHQEYPWIKAREGYKELENSNAKIEPEVMGEYYRSIYIGG
ncbi:DUF4065 domain-containing protein [Peptoniphilus sp. MSJ-1]|uniref:DUF4065 domain-containing protein n=1 Tax=Peptoniphilus ovalis TaxID=2841503 RepID=A0ABS6FE87_9FIRM|nr:type II toxin-antitoxin system antitoxin SocA domain-containing protein [Peptoniphilus ovalis]MBU5668497.1 DUF4065 domain-containing protein [Peptoniphilus ovalis]